MSWRRASSPSRCTACRLARWLSLISTGSIGLPASSSVVGLSFCDSVQAGFDALGERDFLLGGEERNFADLLQVHPNRIEAAAFGVRRARALRRSLFFVGFFVRDATAARTRPDATLRSDGVPRDAAALPSRAQFAYASRALVFELQLFRDLVENFDATRLKHVPQVAQLVGVGFEIGKRREDLAGRNEATLSYLVEHTDNTRRGCISLGHVV